MTSNYSPEDGIGRDNKHTNFINEKNLKVGNELQGARVTPSNCQEYQPEEAATRDSSRGTTVALTGLTSQKRYVE